MTDTKAAETVSESSAAVEAAVLEDGSQKEALAEFWRCGNEVVQKQMPGYYLKITAYAQELLDCLKELEGKWPAQVLTMQENWIGRSEGFNEEIGRASCRERV